MLSLEILCLDATLNLLQDHDQVVVKQRLGALWCPEPVIAEFFRKRLRDSGVADADISEEGVTQFVEAWKARLPRILRGINRVLGKE